MVSFKLCSLPFILLSYSSSDSVISDEIEHVHGGMYGRRLTLSFKMACLFEFANSFFCLIKSAVDSL